jgi:hypothetical protein
MKAERDDSSMLNLPNMDWEESVPSFSCCDEFHNAIEPPVGSRSRTVSPMEADSCPSSSGMIEEWRKDTGSDWGDVMLMGDDDHHCHLDDDDDDNDILAGVRDPVARVLLDASAVAIADDVPSIDEFLVGHSSEKFDFEFQDDQSLPLPPPPHEEESPDSRIVKIPGSPKSFQDLYKETLTNLKESMKRSRETRKSLQGISPQTRRYPRRNSVAQVVSSVESSSRQIDRCLYPEYDFQRRDTR